MTSSQMGRLLDSILTDTRRAMPDATAREAVVLASAALAAARLTTRENRPPEHPLLKLPSFQLQLPSAGLPDLSLGSAHYRGPSATTPLALVAQTSEKFPASRVDEREINELARAYASALTIAGLRALADELADEWARVQERDVAWPTREVARFILDAVDAATGERVRCSGPAAESLAIESLITGRVPLLDQGTPVVQSVAILTDGRVDLEVRSAAGPTQEYWPSKVHSEVLLPRFGMPLPLPHHLRAFAADDSDKISEWAALEYACVSKSRVTAVLVANRVLHSRSFEEIDFRKRIIDSGTVRAIVSLPPGALAAEDVPSALFLFDHTTHRRRDATVFCRVDVQRDFEYSPGKLRTHDRRFAAHERVLRALQNPSESWCRAVPHHEIARENYVLQADRYLDQEAVQQRIRKAARHRKMVALGDIAAITKAQTLRSSSNVSAVEIHEASPGEFPTHGYLRIGPRKRHVDANDLRRYTAQRLEIGDVLLSTKGSIGRTTICAPVDGLLVATPSTTILRLRSGGPIVAPVVLLMYMRAPLFQDQLRAMTAGTTIPNVSLLDIRKLPMVIPTLEEQRELCRVFEVQADLQQRISELQDRQNAAAYEVWDALELADSGETP